MTTALVYQETPSALLTFQEMDYVTETTTGLIFAENTPVEVVGGIISRLTRQHKRIEWAIGDAINFAERRYGGTYEQWVEETGLSENTLATIRWVAGKIESSRRREDVGWSHHREVAGIDDPSVQDRLLEQAADKGMTRWEVRQAVRSEQEKVRGRAVSASSEPMDDPALAWAPTKDELSDQARAALETRLAGLPATKRSTYEAAWIAALVWNEAEDAFKEWRL